VAQAAGLRRIVPEVVQTSGMDCGPASLKAILEGFGVSASYGRLREVCQTEVDGTSIDTIEEVANQLGLAAEQVMLPAEHLLLKEGQALPALVVIALPNGNTHFVVVWSYRFGLVQVMDPGSGRRWMRREAFLRELFIHTYPVAAKEWREWAGTKEFIEPLQVRMKALGLPAATATGLIDAALAQPEWRPLARLDAAVRLVASLVDAGSARRGRETTRLVQRFSEPAGDEVSTEDGLADEMVPSPYWSVTPHEQDNSEQEQLLLHGAVLIRFQGYRQAAATPATPAEDTAADTADVAPALSPELAAVLEESPARPGRALLQQLHADGALAPLLVVAGLAMSAGTVLIEALLFRGMLDISHFLGLGHQRLAAVAALLVMLAGSALLELPIITTTLGYARRLESRLRMSFLAKIPRLADRYFHSRLRSDMAERAHVVHFLRALPVTVTLLIRSVFLLIATTAGIIWLDPRGTPVAVTVAVLSVALPVASQRFLIERDLRVRTHVGALTRFYLDAMLGLIAVRSHGAERPVRHEHEALLVEWWRAGIGQLRVAVVV
jgi:ATP-binding cassette subfamily B protein